MPNIKHEREIIALLMSLRTKGQEETVSKTLYPEDEKPPIPSAIDAVCITNRRTYVIEHTTIESYPDQIGEDHKVCKLLEVEKILENRIAEKGRYNIVFDTETLKDEKISSELIEALSSWVAAEGPKPSIWHTRYSTTSYDEKGSSDKRQANRSCSV